MSTRCWTVEDEGITDRHVAFPPNENLKKSRSIHFDGMSEQNQTLSEAGGFHYWVGMRWYATSNGILIYVGVPYPVATLFLYILDAGVCNHVTLTSIFFRQSLVDVTVLGVQSRSQLSVGSKLAWKSIGFAQFFQGVLKLFQVFLSLFQMVFFLNTRLSHCFHYQVKSWNCTLDWIFITNPYVRLCSNKGTFWMYRMRRWLSKILGTSFTPIPFKHFPFHGSLYRGGHAFGRGENEKSRLRRKVFLLVPGSLWLFHGSMGYMWPFGWKLCDDTWYI